MSNSILVNALAVAGVLAAGCCKCKDGEPTIPAAEVASTAEPQLGDAPQVDEVPPATPDSPATGAQRIEAVYRMGIPFGPCSSRLTKLVKRGESYTSEQRCEDPEWKPQMFELTREEFEGQVLIAVRLADESLGYAEVPLDSVQGGVPEGTTKCFQTPEGAHTACQNADGIITMDAFDGYKLDPPKMDANRGRTLVSYTTE